MLAGQREARRAEKAEKAAEAKAAKETIVAEAEKIAAGNDWRNGANRLRDLLDEWKALPRIDRASDDALWQRFSSARTTYTRRRKAHFAEQDEKREGARVVKERLVKEAEALSDLDRVGPDRRALPRPDARVEGRRPRAQGRRRRAVASASAAPRTPSSAPATPPTPRSTPSSPPTPRSRTQLLVEAEALLPVTDLEAAKKAFRDIADRWEAAGKVPRDRIKDLEGRMRDVEQAIRSVEDDQWKRSDPEKSARADDMVTKLEAAIAKVEADLEKARAAGNDKKIKELEENLASRQSFLDMARRASADFSG